MTLVFVGYDHILNDGLSDFGYCHHHTVDGLVRTFEKPHQRGIRHDSRIIG